MSVIIPAHNAVRFLGAAIDSVRAQTYSDWEVVVVDDGSRDGTWELLQQAGDPRVRSFRRERAGGPAVARNLALEHAGGELVAFLDADDLLLPRYLESQLAYYEAACDAPPGGFASGGGVGGAWPGGLASGRGMGGASSGGFASGGGASRARQGRVGLVTCDARILIDEQYAPFTHLQYIPDRYAPITLERELRLNVIYGACLVPTEVGADVGWFDPELFGTEDYGLWIKILQAGYRAVLNEEVLAVYRRTAGSVSSNIASQGLNNRRAYELALARGTLTARQRRIARRAIRYNRAMEEVALLRFSKAARGGAILQRLHRLPSLLWVALSNPRMWSEWLQLLRTGEAKDAAELRAHP
ncbi:MAG TPA: glycosyltransferase family 2 protein [Solirubrobacteraceae bacterium]|nr:glycosyltransferase family 2 protein [Solirubrobacteraceae bacterium]